MSLLDFVKGRYPEAALQRETRTLSSRIDQN